MLHVRSLEGPSELEKMTRSGLNRPENLNSLALPVEVPREKCGNDDNEETIRNVRNPGVLGHHVFLELSHSHHDYEADSGHNEGKLVNMVE